jgi:uncharacterized membrane protein
MEDAHNLNELKKKLELLISEQATFQSRIKEIKSELDKLTAKDQVDQVSSAEMRSDQVSKEASPPEHISHISLTLVKNQLEHFSEGRTKGGVNYVQFRIVRNGQGHIARMAENGNWALESEKNKQIWKGKFRIDNQLVRFSEITNPSKESTSEQLISAIFEIAEVHVNEEIAVKDVLPIDQSATVKKKSDLERFIGENLISVIGVSVILIGVVFGVKYAIDHNLINPLTRVILAYSLGAAILLSGFKLKKKFENFSAVLVSGAMSIMYFVTFAAYDFYGLLPQLAAFAIMIIFTIFMVIAAIKYDIQVMAYIGLLGSYAIPFFLSDGSGNVLALFSYIAILNAGILILGFNRNWKALYYGAFVITYLIFGLWFLTAYRNDQHFYILFGFSILYYTMFYITFLAYKLIRKEQFDAEDIMMIIANSTLFYGIGYVSLEGNQVGKDYLGLFTVGVAVTHFIVSVVFHQLKLADRKLFYLSSTMVVVFLTIAIPVQLDGNMVTFLWGAEAALLFYIGRTKAIQIYENISFVTLTIGLISLLHDWFGFYAYYGNPTGDTLLNVTFLTSLFMIFSLGVITVVNRNRQYWANSDERRIELLKGLSVLFPILLIAFMFTAPLLEINFFFNQLSDASVVHLNETIQSGWNWIDTVRNADIQKSMIVWEINYALVFFTALTFIASKKWDNKGVFQTLLVVNILLTLVFLTAGLYNLSELRESYLTQPMRQIYEYTSALIVLRYISLALFGLFIYFTYRMVLSKEVIHSKDNVLIVIGFHSIILWLVSSEMINLISLTGMGAEYKLGLSVLWGVYSFLLVGFGIWKRRQYMRIIGIALFGIVLIKLFFYDIASASTLAKTIVFILIGIILVIISFLYNKFNARIHDEN